MVKHYSEEEMDNNLTNICKYIINFYNNENGRHLKKAEPRNMRAVLRYVIYPVEYLLFKGYNKRWLILKDDMISYLNSPTSVTGTNV